MNSSSAAYTTQIENLVSHGYVVASIEPQIDRTVVSFSNSQLAPFAASVRRVYTAGTGLPAGLLIERAVQQAFVREKSLAADVSLTLDKLIAIEGQSKDIAPFAGRLDFSKVGVVTLMAVLRQQFRVSRTSESVLA